MYGFDIGAPMSLVDSDELYDLAPKATASDGISQQLLDSASDDLADKQFRADSMAIALTWLEEGDFSSDAMNALVAGMADVDGDEEINDSEQEYYDSLYTMAADALVELGGDVSNVQEFMEGDDEAGAKLGAFLSGRMDDVESADDELVSKYAVKQSLIMDATVKVVRNGKVVLKKIPLRKKKLSSAQKMALKKARRKANTSSARKKRQKAMRLRKSRSL